MTTNAKQMTTLIYEFLLVQDKNFAEQFRKKFKCEKASVGAPSLNEIVDFYLKKGPKADKLKSKSVSDDSSSEEELPKAVIPNGVKQANKRAKSSTDDSSDEEEPKAKVAKLPVSKSSPTKQPPKKAESSSEDSSDEDEPPKKAVTGPKTTPVPKPQAKKESSSDDSSDEEEPKKTVVPVKPAPKTQQKKKESSSDDSSDEEEPPKKVVPSIPKKNTPVAQPQQKKKESSSEESSDEEQPTKIAAASKPAVAKVQQKKKESSSEESSSDEEPPKNVSTPKPAAKPQQKKEESSSEGVNMEDNEEKTVNFHEMELDGRILKAIAKLQWRTPTLIQEKSIPLQLEGKDVLIRARTGSGKTAAFTVPIIQKILNLKETAVYQEVKAVILAPSRELCNQINNVVKDLTIKCSTDVSCIDVAPNIELDIQKPLLREKPDIIVGTPARILMHLKSGNLELKKSLEVLVIDEADLIFSFGYKDEVKELLSYLPKIYQTILASATLSEDVLELKSIVLHNAVTLKLEEPEIPPTSQLSHYHLMAEELDKATILYALLKLHLIRGKTIIFVNTVDKGYKLKLYLEQFRIPVCVLNSELPSSTRCHSVYQFNQDIYDIIVASDEKALEDTASFNKKGKPEQSSKRRKDKESGVSRGIDFQRVANVINFDFPVDVQSYIHRAGRTARGNNQGNVLSFINLREKAQLDKVEERLKAGLKEISIFKKYQFKLEEVEPFKYRAQDAWRAVTRIAVREARLKEIKQEIFNCQKLKGFFDDNPTDLKVLRHDKPLHTVRIQEHLADVPEYMLPPSLKSLAGMAKRKKKSFKNRQKPKRSKFEAARNNPLFSFKFTRTNQKPKVINDIK